METKTIEGELSPAVKFDELCVRATKKFAGMDEKTSELFRLAWELDALRARLHGSAVEMARRFSRYANAISEGGPVAAVPEPPTSTLRDMDRDSATYAADLAAFKGLFRVATGLKLRDVVEELLAEKAAVAAEKAEVRS